MKEAQVGRDVFCSRVGGGWMLFLFLAGGRGMGGCFCGRAWWYWDVGERACDVLSVLWVDPCFRSRLSLDLRVFLL